jgi:hypothetical protein
MAASSASMLLTRSFTVTKRGSSAHCGHFSASTSQRQCCSLLVMIAMYPSEVGYTLYGQSDMPVCRFAVRGAAPPPEP